MLTAERQSRAFFPMENDKSDIMSSEKIFRRIISENTDVMLIKTELAEKEKTGLGA